MRFEVTIFSAYGKEYFRSKEGFLRGASSKEGANHLTNPVSGAFFDI
jgi:hypothetical protein